MAVKNIFSLSKILTFLLWMLFIANVIFLGFSLTGEVKYQYGDIFRINGFTILICTVVTFFSALISKYATNI